MPKYISRVQFDQMKVFKKRKSTNKDIAKAIGISPATVSRNLKYNSYEDYLVAMHLNSSKSQQEIESKSGPVKVVGKVKTCTKCGKTKKLEEFDKLKKGLYGRSPRCKECTREYQREWWKKKQEAKKDNNVKTIEKAEAPKPGAEQQPVCAPYCGKVYDTTQLEEDLNNDELKVNEAVYVYDGGKVRCGIIRAINNTCIETYYIVAIKRWFCHKLIKVNSYSVFRMED